MKQLFMGRLFREKILLLGFALLRSQRWRWGWRRRWILVATTAGPGVTWRPVERAVDAGPERASGVNLVLASREQSYESDKSRR